MVNNNDHESGKNNNISTSNGVQEHWLSESELVTEAEAVKAKENTGNISWMDNGESVSIKQLEGANKTNSCQEDIGLQMLRIMQRETYIWKLPDFKNKTSR